LSLLTLLTQRLTCCQEMFLTNILFVSERKATIIRA
jgi:hypothetical protein